MRLSSRRRSGSDSFSFLGPIGPRLAAEKGDKKEGPTLGADPTKYTGWNLLRK
jgi:hypothetical protein